MTTQKSREHLCSWIRTEQLLQDLNDDAINKSTQSVLELFTSNDELLHFICQHTSKEKLDLIYDILKKEDEQQNLIQNGTPATNATTSTVFLSNFDKISKDSISNICGYLTRYDIEFFKETSRRISVICLEEMGKYSIGICDGLQIIKANINDIKNRQWFNYMSYDRYYNTTRYEVLFSKIDQRYNIPSKHQIPITIHYHNKKNTFDCIGNAFNNITPNKSIITFDKREITVLNDDIYYDMTVNDVFDPTTDTLIILYEFNINQQHIEYVKCVKINGNVSVQVLKNYVMTLVAHNNAINIYRITDFTTGFVDDYYFVETDEDLVDVHRSTPFLFLVFQVDTDVNPDIWSPISEEYLVKKLKYCHLHFDDYIYYLAEMQDEEREIDIMIENVSDINTLKPEIKAKMNTFEHGYNVNIDCDIKPIAIKKHIAGKLDYIIGYENIELFVYDKYKENSRRIVNDKECSDDWYDGKIYFEIVPYNTTAAKHVINCCFTEIDSIFQI